MTDDALKVNSDALRALNARQAARRAQEAAGTGMSDAEAFGLALIDLMRVVGYTGGIRSRWVYHLKMPMFSPQRDGRRPSIPRDHREKPLGLNDMQAMILRRHFFTSISQSANGRKVTRGTSGREHPVAVLFKSARRFVPMLEGVTVFAKRDRFCELSLDDDNVEAVMHHVADRVALVRRVDVVKFY